MNFHFCFERGQIGAVSDVFGSYEEGSVGPHKIHFYTVQYRGTEYSSPVQNKNNEHVVQITIYKHRYIIGYNTRYKHNVQ